MALDSKKAPTPDQNAASTERQSETAELTSEIQTQVEEPEKKKTTTQKTAQQHDARPEGQKQPQGLTQTNAPKALEAEDDDVRRISDEFALRWSPEAEQHVKGKSAEYVRTVSQAAYERIYAAERALCGIITIIPIGRVAPIEDYDRWWVAFQVGELWFMLRYHDTFVREYELMPAFGPSPGDGGEPPPRRRQQRKPPPPRIGVRARGRRNRDDAQGSRAAVVGQSQRKTRNAIKKAKEKLNEAKRVIERACDRARGNFLSRRYSFNHSLLQLWRQKRPRFLHSIEAVKQLSGITLTTYRNAAATFVQLRQDAERLSERLSKYFSRSFTGTREFPTETYGPSARLERCDAGHGVIPRLRLNSWRWDEPPVPWAEYIFGVDWTLNPFGVLEEEQAFT